MIIQSDNVDVIERIGINTESTFSIEFNSKMAAILSNGLYSDKVQSVIRELSCNAWDSHVEAGKAKIPFQVHFPTTLEPWFSVQDFGVGLTHDQVVNIYTRYGASTKTNSNDVIGQLGLGSKSPFALTNAFNVTTRKDGVENHYSMYRNEQGMPCVAKLGQNLTDEPNGVTVRVPVRAEQRREFLDKAREVYKWFPVQPRLEGVDDIGIEQPVSTYEGTGWRILKAHRDRYGYSNRQQPVALMGMVAYPLHHHQIHSLRREHQAILNTGLVLEFNIGDLEVAANREALGYDDRTIQNITAKLDVVLSELGARFEKEISGAATEWQARKRFGEIFGSSSEHYYEFHEAFGQRGLNWNGVVIKEERIRRQITDIYPLDKDKKTTDVIHFCNINYKRPRRANFGPNDSHTFLCADKTRIYFNDVGLGGLARVHEFNKSKCYDLDIIVFGEAGTISAAKISKRLGDVEVQLVSSLPKPVRTKPEKRTNMLRWTGKAGKARAWQQVEIDINAGGYYVELDGWDVVTDKTIAIEADRFADRLRTMKDSGVIPAGVEIYAMRGKNRDAVRQDPDWKELFSTAKAEVESKVRALSLAQHLADTQSYNNLNGESVWALWSDINIRCLKLDNSPMRAFCEHVLEIKQMLTNKGDVRAHALEDLAKWFSIDLGQATAKYDLRAEYRVIMRQYPMLRFVGSRFNRPNSADVADAQEYINYVDMTNTFYRLTQEETQVD